MGAAGRGRGGGGRACSACRWPSADGRMQMAECGRHAASVRSPCASTHQSRTKEDRRPLSNIARGQTSGWLQCQSRVANPQRRPKDGYRPIIHTARCSDQSQRSGPEGRDQRRRTGVVVIDSRGRFDQGVRSVIANLQARLFGAGRFVVMAGGIAGASNQLGMRWARRSRWPHDHPGMRFRRLQETGIRDTGSKREQPHQQHRECGVALDAGVSEELHVGCEFLAVHATQAPRQTD